MKIAQAIPARARVTEARPSQAIPSSLLTAPDPYFLVLQSILRNGSVTRASKAWDWNSEGLIQEYANNTPVIGHDPSDNSLRGLTIRKAWTNSLLDNRDPRPSGSNWSGTATVAINATGADGVANSAATVTDDNSGNQESVLQDITIANNSNTHSAKFLIKKTSSASTFPGIQFDCFGGTTATRSQWSINTGTGQETGVTGFSGDGTAIAVDAGDWWEVEVTVANNGTGNTTLRFGIYPAVTTDAGNTWSNTPTGSIIYDFGGVYLNSSYAGPPIITGSSAVTREADDITVSSIPWFNASEGTVYIDGLLVSLLANHRYFQFDNDSETQRMQIADSGATHNFSVVDSTTQASLTATEQKDFKIAAAYKANDFAASFNGGASQTDTSGTVPTVDRARIGKSSSAGSPEYIEGWIKDLIYYPSRLPNATLESLSGS